MIYRTGKRLESFCKGKLLRRLLTLSEVRDLLSHVTIFLSPCPTKLQNYPDANNDAFQLMAVSRRRHSNGRSWFVFRENYTIIHSEIRVTNVETRCLPSTRYFNVSWLQVIRLLSGLWYFYTQTCLLSPEWMASSLLAAPYKTRLKLILSYDLDSKFSKKVIPLFFAKMFSSYFIKTKPNNKVIKTLD